MTKEELEKKRDKAWEKSFGMTHYDYFKSGFDSAVNLLLPRLEHAEKILEQYISGHETIKNLENKNE